MRTVATPQMATEAPIVVPSSSSEYALQENWQPFPFKVDSRYDWNWSTEDNYKVEGEELFGPFKNIREQLDYDFHVHYSRERQELQDKILQFLLEMNNRNKADSRPCPTSSRPWVIFTAGVMGAGKSFTVHRLYQQGLFPLRSFVIVDPDEIRRLLPEFRVYLDESPLQAGTFTRKEAGMMAEILSMAALERGQNVLKDGSLRDAQWYENYFSELRLSFPGVRLGIIHVTAPIEIIHERVKERAKQTGRSIPRDVLERAVVEVPHSVNLLKNLVDFFVKIDNSIQHDGEANIVETGVSLAKMNEHFQVICDR
jgi:predicted kinase